MPFNGTLPAIKARAYSSMRKLLIPTLVFLLSCTSLFASPEVEHLEAYLLSWPQTVEETITAPLSWETQDWLAAGGVILIGGGLYLADEELRELAQRNQNPLGDAISPVVRQFGEYKLVFPALLLTTGLGYVCDSHQTVDTGLLSLKSAILASAATQGLKLATQRHRPDEERGPAFWNGSGLSLEAGSFPSGHSTLIWSIAPILAEQYRETAWVPVLAYSVASLTSLSRVYDDKHWSSDIFTGAVIGYLAGRMTLKSTPRFSLHPAVNQPGLGFSWNF